MKRVIAIVLLAVCVLSFASCKDAAKEYYPIDWEYVTGLPEGFPKLCDGITSTEENTANGSTILFWNVIEESRFKELTEKIAKWAGVPFTKSQSDTGTVYKLETAEYRIECSYCPNASGDHLEGARYDSQGRVIVVKK